MHLWSKETQNKTLPSGQTAARNNKRITVRDSQLFSGKYPRNAYGRNFTASELAPVPQDKHGLPIVEEAEVLLEDDEADPTKEKFTIERIVSRKTKKSSTRIAGIERWMTRTKSRNASACLPSLKTRVTRASRSSRSTLSDEALRGPPDLMRISR